MILDSGFPRTDPYTFTAAGDAWIPQSWAASVLYEALNRLGGAFALRLQFAVLTGLLALAGWLLTRSAGGVATRVAVVAPYLLMGTLGWSHRPYLFGYMGLAAVLLVVQGSLDRRWLLPAGWIWLNTHGSWPLGLLALGVLIAGRRLDRERAVSEVDALRWLLAGLALGCLNPYGPRLLAFPLTALQRRATFSRIVEWQPPTFDARSELAFFLVLGLALVALRRRPSWRLTSMIFVFATAGLLSARNLPVAAIVLLPVTAEAFASRGPGVPRLLVRAAPVLAAAVAALSFAVVVTGPGFNEAAYPVEATQALSDDGLGPLDVRWVTQDFVGNWLDWRFGANGQVFIDDRFELPPADLVQDYVVLLDGRPMWEEVLEDYGADVVVWQANHPLASLLRASACWRIVHEDEKFIAAHRTTTEHECARAE